MKKWQRWWVFVRRPKNLAVLTAIGSLLGFLYVESFKKHFARVESNVDRPTEARAVNPKITVGGEVRATGDCAVAVVGAQIDRIECGMTAKEKAGPKP